jgi:hypothetical protein
MFNFLGGEKVRLTRPKDSDFRASLRLRETPESSSLPRDLHGMTTPP